jgi:hypothetical protein
MYRVLLTLLAVHFAGFVQFVVLACWLADLLKGQSASHQARTTNYTKPAKCTAGKANKLLYSLLLHKRYYAGMG